MNQLCKEGSENLKLLAGTDIHTLARQMETSLLMLKRNNSKLTATLAADKLAG